MAIDGTIDWFCPRRFDAPSLFGALRPASRKLTAGRPEVAHILHGLGTA